MGDSSKAKLANEILSAYREGTSPSTIAIRFGLSERNFKDIKSLFAQKFKQADRVRAMNQKKKREKLRTNLHGKRVNLPKAAPKATSEEKIKHLEKLLESEQKKNKELESLLAVAKEHLGKF